MTFAMSMLLSNRISEYFQQHAIVLPDKNDECQEKDTRRAHPQRQYNERCNKLLYSPDGATAIRVILLMRCSGRHWQPKQKQTWDAVLRTQMQ